MLGDRASGFLGSCLPSGAMLGSSAGLKGSCAAALHRLAAQGVGWAPTVGNLCTLLCFVLALALNAQLNEVQSYLARCAGTSARLSKSRLVSMDGWLVRAWQWVSQLHHLDLLPRHFCLQH